MATVTITIETANDAFQDGAHGAFETARILFSIADRMQIAESLHIHPVVRDSNGNKVGGVEVTE